MGKQAAQAPLAAAVELAAELSCALPTVGDRSYSLPPPLLSPLSPAAPDRLSAPDRKRC